MTAACGQPLDLARLLEYWFGELTPPDEERTEEHLLGCGACSERLGALVALGDGVRRLARQGAVPLVVTPSFLATAAREGLRMREYRAVSGDRVACTVTPEDDLLLGRLVADFSGVSRLDMVVQREGQAEQRLEDVPVDPGASELVVAQSMPAVRPIEHAVTRFRLLAREKEGDRLLGEYTFEHRATRRG